MRKTHFAFLQHLKMQFGGIQRGLQIGATFNQGTIDKLNK
jgi:hypothetical protein